MPSAMLHARPGENKQPAADKRFIQCAGCPHPPDRCLLRSFVEFHPDLVASVVTLSPRTSLFKQGDVLRMLYVVCDGYMKLSHHCGESDPVVVQLAGPGSILGLHSAVSQRSFELSAESVTRVTVKAMDRSVFFEMLRLQSELQARALQALGQAYDWSLELASGLEGNRTACERVANLLVALGRQLGHAVDGAEVSFPRLLSLEELGGMAGVTRETATRILSSFRKCGWISIDRDSLRLHQPEKLCSIDKFRSNERASG